MSLGTVDTGECRIRTARIMARCIERRGWTARVNIENRSDSFSTRPPYVYVHANGKAAPEYEERFRRSTETAYFWPDELGPLRRWLAEHPIPAGQQRFEVAS